MSTSYGLACSLACPKYNTLMLPCQHVCSKKFLEAYDVGCMPCVAWLEYNIPLIHDNMQAFYEKFLIGDMLHTAQSLVALRLMAFAANCASLLYVHMYVYVRVCVRSRVRVLCARRVYACVARLSSVNNKQFNLHLTRHRPVKTVLYIHYGGAVLICSQICPPSTQTNKQPPHLTDGGY